MLPEHLSRGQEGSSAVIFARPPPRPIVKRQLHTLAFVLLYTYRYKIAIARCESEEISDIKELAMKRHNGPPSRRPVLPVPVRRCIRSRLHPRLCAANDQRNDVGAVIGFYLAGDGAGNCGADGIDGPTRALARSLQEFIAPEGRPAHRDEIAERIQFLSCMLEDILVTAPLGR